MRSSPRVLLALLLALAASGAAKAEDNHPDPPSSCVDLDSMEVRLGQPCGSCSRACGELDDLRREIDDLCRETSGEILERST